MIRPEEGRVNLGSRWTSWNPEATAAFLSSATTAAFAATQAKEAAMMHGDAKG